MSKNGADYGVERCELQTGDMLAMPFDDDTFDVVVSSLAIHNIARWAGASGTRRSSVQAWSAPRNRPTRKHPTDDPGVALACLDD